VKKDIRLLLVELLSNETIVGSWGISSIIVLDNHISFNVSGFQFQGNIAIEVLYNCYSIKLGDKMIVYVALKEMVTALDALIEAGNSYYNDIANWIRGM